MMLYLILCVFLFFLCSGYVFWSMVVDRFKRLENMIFDMNQEITDYHSFKMDVINYGIKHDDEIGLVGSELEDGKVKSVIKKEMPVKNLKTFRVDKVN